MKLKNIIIFLLGAMILASCEETDPIKYSGPSEASFVSEYQKIYGEKGMTYAFKVGVSSVSVVDRKVNIEVVFDAKDADVIAGKQAIENTHYTIAKEVLIPANKAIGEFVISPIYNSLPTELFNLDLKLVSNDQIKVASYRNTLSLDIVKFKKFDEAALLGTYVDDALGRESELIKSSVEGEYELTGFADGVMKFKFIYSNPADYHTIVSESSRDNVWYHSSKYSKDVIINPKGAKGAFSMIEKSFELVFNADIPGLGSFGEQRVKLIKK